MDEGDCVEEISELDAAKPDCISEIERESIKHCSRVRKIRLLIRSQS